MNQRQLGILFAASLTVLAVAVWVAHRAQRGSASIAGTTVLPGLGAQLNDVTQIRIRGAGGEQVTLVKGARHWMVRERDYPADSGKLRKLLIDLGNLKAMARKTRLRSNYPLLGVQAISAAGASGVRIDVRSPEHTWSLIVGHTSGGSGVYVRAVGHRQSLLATPLVMAEAKPAHWLAPIIVNVPQKQVRSVAERLAGERPYRIERAADTVANFSVLGVPPGRKLTGPGAADPVANALANLTLSDVRKAAPPPQGIRLSSAEFKTFDGLALTVSGYRDGAHGPHYIEISAQGTGTQAAAAAARINARVKGWQYRLPGYSYQQIFQKLSGLLQPLPRPHLAARHKPAA